MTYDGTNYPATEHSILFWVVFLTVIIVATVAMLGVFLIAVARDGQQVRALPADETTDEPTDEPAALPAQTHTPISSAA